MTSQLFNFDADFGARYDRFVRQAIFAYEPMFTLFLAMLRRSLGETANVLVVGSGTGMELLTFARHMPQWTFTGIDPSEQMIHLAQAKLDGEQMSERVRLHRGVVDSLPDGEQFDAATLILVLHFLPDDGSKLALLKGIAARLKSGASLVLLDLGADFGSEQKSSLLAGWKNYQILMGMEPGLVESVYQQASETQHFIPETRLRELLAEAGFVQVERFYQAFLHTGWSAQKA